LPAEHAERLLGRALEHEYSLADLLRRPNLDFDAVVEAGRLASGDGAETVSRETLRGELGRDLADTVIEQLEISIRYAGYIEKQQEAVDRAQQYEDLRLPPDLDYREVPALGHEVTERLQTHRPETLGQASRVSGVTPAAVSLLLVHLKRARHRSPASTTVPQTIDPKAA
jgi:tRNA uridine 5-carboxymethylaminomethyl modification enzyme